MNELAWRGIVPSSSLRARLEAHGWRLGGAAPRVVVHQTRRAALPPHPPEMPWIWLSGAPVHTSVVVVAVSRGAVDVISTRSQDWEERLLSRLTECATPEPPLKAPPGFVAESAAARQLLRQIHQAARTSMPVLLTGETGTGKELAARLIHQWSARASRTFVPINCAAIPNELMEGELFGYVKGAFSGAVRSYDGLVAAAEGGTVFLDEIDDTPYALQVKLLRVLEDRVVSRLGENAWRKVDFRALAATNRDLRPLIAQQRFGADLYERLATLEIRVPPLRERGEDLPRLLELLMTRYYTDDPERSSRVRRVTPEALEVLGGYDWPGNVRELRNVVFGALVSKQSGEELLVSDLPRRLWQVSEEAPEGIVSRVAIERQIAAGKMSLRRERERLERLALETALRRTGGNASEAARLLGEVGRGAAKDPGGTVRRMRARLKLGRQKR